MCKLVLKTRGKQALITGAAGVLLGLPLSAGDAPAPSPIAPVAAPTPVTPVTPVAGPAAPNFQSQQYNAEVQRQLNLLYQQDPQAPGQPALPQPPPGPPQLKKMQMKDWFSPTAWKRYNNSRQRVREYEERQRASAGNAPETTLGKPSDVTLGGSAPLAPAVSFALENAAPRAFTPPPVAPPAIGATPPAEIPPPVVASAAPTARAARPQLQRVSPEVFGLPSESETPQPPAFDFDTAATTPAPAEGHLRLLPAPGSSDDSDTQTPTFTILPDPAAGSIALRAAPPAELTDEFDGPPQETNGFFDEPAVSLSELPESDESPEALFGSASAQQVDQPNPFELEAVGPYTGLELDENPFAAPEPLPTARPEASAPTTLPTFAAEFETPASEPVAALLPLPLPAAADATMSAIPTRLATDTTERVAPTPLPPTTAPTRTAATTVSASTAPTDVRQKLSRISERRGLTGFKGFCPVMLHDYRELVDAKLEHTAEHKGRQYWFSSAAAQETFLLNPAPYIPARGGIDVVIYDEIGAQQDGSLDHAVWYRGQLYMFSSSETQAAFSAQPHLHQTE